jgi:YHS domain-containing protein
MKTFFIYLSALIALAVVASAAEVVNIDKNGLALQGYDPVAYFTDGEPVKGSPQFTATYKGATYQFASAEHKQLFEKAPAKYEPQFGGFCGYAASINKLAPIQVEYFQVLHDRLILQHNKKAWDLWHKDVEGNLQKADANWPALSQQKAP